MTTSDCGCLFCKLPLRIRRPGTTWKHLDTLFTRQIWKRASLRQKCQKDPRLQGELQCKSHKQTNCYNLLQTVKGCSQHTQPRIKLISCFNNAKLPGGRSKDINGEARDLAEGVSLKSTHTQRHTDSKIEVRLSPSRSCETRLHPNDCNGYKVPTATRFSQDAGAEYLPSWTMSVAATSHSG